jgi:transposase
MVEAILWKHRTGAPWRDMPEAFGPWTSIYTRFNAWSKRGVWQEVLEWLRKDADLEWVMLDGTIAPELISIRPVKKGAPEAGARTLPWRDLDQNSFAP